MSVSERDLQHVAELARLALPSERVPALVAELNGILSHMHVLKHVQTKLAEPVGGVGSGGMPLRSDDGPSYALHRDRETFAPAMRDGFFLVPRLASHADPAVVEPGGHA